MVLVLDLSKPSELWNTLEKILHTAREELEHSMQALNQTDPATFDRMISATKRRVVNYGVGFF